MTRASRWLFRISNQSSLSTPSSLRWLSAWALEAWIDLWSSILANAALISLASSSVGSASSLAGETLAQVTTPAGLTVIVIASRL